MRGRVIDGRGARGNEDARGQMPVLAANSSADPGTLVSRLVLPAPLRAALEDLNVSFAGDLARVPAWRLAAFPRVGQAGVARLRAALEGGAPHAPAPARLPQHQRPRRASPWDAERVALLVSLAAAGASAAEISGRLGGGITKSAAIGKIHRLGLAWNIGARACGGSPGEAA